MIQVALLFIIIGAGVKYGKAYFLIAGYNTMPKEAKAKYDIEGIATVFWNTFFGMALAMILGYFLSEWLDYSIIENITFFGSIIIGTAYLLIKTNSKKFKIGQPPKKKSLEKEV